MSQRTIAVTRPVIDGDMKRCGRCGEHKPFGDFHQQRNGSGGLRSYCKPCNRTAVDDYRSANPGVTQKYHQSARYGMAPGQMCDMLEAQGHLCAVCRGPNTQFDKRTGRLRSLHVDHDHETGEVRGLLCHKCNLALGNVDDSIERLRQLVDYLGRVKTT